MLGVTAVEFFYLKGALSLVATLLLLFHMNRSWHQFRTAGQKLRYLTLLYFAVLFTSASVGQISDGSPVNIRNVGVLVGVVLLVVAMVVSIRED